MSRLTVQEQIKKEPKLFRTKLGITLVVLGLLLWSSTSVNVAEFNEKGLEISKNIIKGIFTPDLEFLLGTTQSGVPYLILETASIAFLGTLIGAVVAIPLAFLSASNMVPKRVSYIGIAIITFIRVFPVFVLGLMFIRVTGPGAFAGVLTIGLSSVGMIAKLYTESIEDLDKGIIEALDAAGCTTFQRIRYGILPQLATNFISSTIYRFEINIKNASVLGLVGAGGIGAPLISHMGMHRWNKVGAILVGLIVLVLIVEFFSTKIRTKLATGE